MLVFTRDTCDTWRLHTPQGICESVITLNFCLQRITGIYTYFLSTDYTDYIVFAIQSTGNLFHPFNQLTF